VMDAASMLLKNPSMILPDMSMDTFWARQTSKPPRNNPIFATKHILRRPHWSIIIPPTSEPNGLAPAYRLAEIHKPGSCSVKLLLVLAEVLTVSPVAHWNRICPSKWSPVYGRYLTSFTAAELHPTQSRKRSGAYSTRVHKFSLHVTLVILLISHIPQWRILMYEAYVRLIPFECYPSVTRPCSVAFGRVRRAQ
jgi:hypothetical protein